VIFDFVCDELRFGYSVFKAVFDEYSLRVCDSLMKDSSVTYANDALGQYSCIDHFVVSQSVLQCVQTVSVIDSGSNFSDHKPIVLHANLSLAPSPCKVVKSKNSIKSDGIKGSL